MLNFASDSELNFIVVKSGSRSDAITISIHEIQPTEDLLTKEVVEYFLRFPEIIFETKAKISIIKSNDVKFRFHVRDGNNRLFVLYSLGINEVEIVPDDSEHAYVNFDKLDKDTANDTHERGIICWEQLKNNIVPREEYFRIMHKRYDME